METDQLLMTQKERDRLVALKKARKRLIAQKQSAVETGVSERPVRRLVRRLKRRGDRAVIHAARGERPNRQLDEELRAKAVEILSRDVYRALARRSPASTWRRSTRYR